MATIGELLEQGFRAFRRSPVRPAEWIHVRAVERKGDHAEVSFCAHHMSRDSKGDADPNQWDDWQGCPWEHTAIEEDDLIGALGGTVRGLLSAMAVGGIIRQMEEAIRAGTIEEKLAEFKEKLDMPDGLIDGLRAAAAERKIEIETERIGKSMGGKTIHVTHKEMRA